MEPQQITIRGAQQHNLKHIDVAIPRNRLVVLTGVSGSGKSSLAFDTIYAEGQRRYVESLSSFIRQFLRQTEKPKVDYIGGLSPAIAIEQKAVSKNPRSTVGTVTEVMDYLRILFARIGEMHCPTCGRLVQAQSAQQIAGQIEQLDPGMRFQILAPLVKQRKGTHRNLLAQLRRDGYLRARVDGVPVELDGSIKLAKTKQHTIDVVVDRLVVPEQADEDFATRLMDSVETALKVGEGSLLIEIAGNGELLFSEHHACAHCGISFPELTPQLFSFNSPLGMCPECNGLGTKLEVDPSLIVQDPTLSVLDGALRWYGDLRKKKRTWQISQLTSIAGHYGVDLDQPWGELPQHFRDVIIRGSGDERVHFEYHAEGKDSSWSGKSYRPVQGIIYHINRLFNQTRSDYTRRWYQSFMSEQPCSVCGGARLRPEAQGVTVGRRTLVELGAMTIDDAHDWVTHLYATLDAEQQQIAEEILKEIRDRLQFMLNVGLHYLTLDRSAPSLSGGESQRIRLASQIGCGLVGVLYILDEPSIGLHARDNRALLETLLELRDMGNTVLVVEHDAETMETADWIVDMGPGAGILGGEIVAEGTPDAIRANPASLTGRYLSGELSVVNPIRSPQTAPERKPRAAGREPTQSEAHRRPLPAGDDDVRDGRERQRQEQPGRGDTPSRAGARSEPGGCQAGPVGGHRWPGAPGQGDYDHPGPDRPDAAIESRDIHRALQRDPRRLRIHAGGEDARLRCRAFQLQRQGWALRVVQRPRAEACADALSARRLGNVQGVRRDAV